MKKHSKIYIAGHNGMVGSAIMRLLTKEGYTNLVTVSRQELDLRNPIAVENFFKKENPEYVFLVAAKVGGIQANKNNPVDFLLNNLMIQNNVISQSYISGIKKLAFLGSSCIYPRECPQPMKEEYLMTGPLEPTNEGYALAKIAGLRLAQYYHSQYGLSCINPIPCNLYGPNDNFDPNDSHVLAALIKKIVDAAFDGKPSVVLWGTGIAKREFMHVDDLGRALLFLMNEWDSSDIINVGCGYDVSIRELAILIASKVGYKGEIIWDKSKPDGMLRKCMDISKISDLGFKPSVLLENGIDGMIKEYKKL